MMLRIGHGLAASLLLGLAGCSGASERPPMAPVSGEVLYKGQPVAGAIVTFVTEKSPRTSSGITDQHGRFDLTTFVPDDGALIGENLVSIVRNEPTGDRSTQNMDPMQYAKAMQSGRGLPKFQTRSTIPTEYADPHSSGLKRIVVAGEKNHFKFELTD